MSTITNKERVGRALDALRPELAKYVEQELRDVYAEEWQRHLASEGDRMDNQRLLNTLIGCWEDVFETVLARGVRNTAHDVRQVRNRFAHDEEFSCDDTVAALIDIQKLLEAIKSPAAEQVEHSKHEFLRSQYQVQEPRKESKKPEQPSLELAGLKPWRDVILPHEDVAKGRFQQAEFAADLWQVFQGGGTDEYRDPRAFFERTYMTEGLRDLLVNAVARLRGEGGNPVVELKINFGGGKTHSMLALFHLFAGQTPAPELAGIPEVLDAAGVAEVPGVQRAVIVGNTLYPGSPREEDGVKLNTLWGEIAWQLAGREGYEIVRRADETATNPGALLDQVFALAGPSLILIDEWVAYARQLHDRKNMLPAGHFDTQFTFAQTLCEAARRAKNVLVCVSIPASVRDGEESTFQAGEVGGQRALDMLQAAVGRSNMEWRPATSDESFEIVRRRLFQPISPEREPFQDAVVNAFAALYRTSSSEFPTTSRAGDYARRMKAAYPIHPLLFDLLYNQWSTLEKFQRTRGVLRLMATVIHSLWASGDADALILPSSIPLSDRVVRDEVTRYLPENWAAVLDRDVDGETSIPAQLDGEYASTYGRYRACRRVARTVFMGSAPTKGTANRGIEEREIKLGCLQPKQTVATFGDALGKLRQRTTYLYADANRYWYHTQASVSREAQERADRVTAEEIRNEVAGRLKAFATNRYRGEFAGIHVDLPSGEIPDDRALRLVVLGTADLHRQGRQDSEALKRATEIMELRGSAPRLNKNRLIFIALDGGRFQELEQSIRQTLAWKSICDDVIDKRIDLDNSNKAQAEASRVKSQDEVAAKLGQIASFMLVPYQPNPVSPCELQVTRCPGEIGQLSERVVKRLVVDENLVRELAPTILGKYLDEVPLWRASPHIAISRLLEDFAQFTYLPRILDDEVLLKSIRAGTSPLAGEEGLAYADSYDEAAGEYQGLRFSAMSMSAGGWIVKGGHAAPLIDAKARDENGYQPIPPAPKPWQGDIQNFWGSSKPPEAPAKKKSATRFHGSIRLRHSDFREKAGDVSREVAQLLAKVVGSDVELIVEVVASADNGFPEDVRRSVTENCRTLKFDNFEFEED